MRKISIRTARGKPIKWTAAGSDTLRLEGISPAALNVYAANGDWLVIDYGATDRVAIVNGLGGAIERIAVGGETLTRSITVDGGITHYRHTYANFSSSGEAAEGGADVLYGGAGNDWIMAGVAHASNLPDSDANSRHGCLTNTPKTWGCPTYTAANDEGSRRVA